MEVDDYLDIDLEVVTVDDLYNIIHSNENTPILVLASGDVSESSFLHKSDDVDTVPAQLSFDDNELLWNENAENDVILSTAQGPENNLENRLALANIINIDNSTPTTSHPEDVQKRLRRRHPESTLWEKNMIASKVLKGEEHVNRKKKVIPAKAPKYVPCNCIFDCLSHISEDQQRLLFDEYRSINSRKDQRSYLKQLMFCEAVKRRRVDDDDRKKQREHAVTYSLKTVPSADSESNLIRVCRTFFLNTFGISETVTKNIIKNLSPTSGTYGRKSHGNTCRIPVNKTSSAAERQVVSFLASIPKQPSHYCRKDSSYLYFEPTLDKSKLYRIYKAENGDSSVTFGVFDRIFKEHEPPLAFYKPRKDQCTTCLNHDPDEYFPHIERKVAISTARECDKEEAIAQPDRFRYATFDLQAILTLPYSENSQLYYSRKLSVYNFTIYDNLRNGLCHVWDETNGKKGSVEVGTCILDYLATLPDSVEKVTFYCDTCGGQNRNKLIVASLLYAVNSELCKVQTIDLKYFESGHSMMEADSMHSAIERKRRNLKVYTPQEYCLIMQMARHDPRPYEVKQYTYKDFYDIRTLTTKLIKGKKQVDGESDEVSYLKVKHFRFERNSPLVLFKYFPTEDFQVLDVHKTKKSCSTTADILKAIITAHPLKRNAYVKRLPISMKKKQDFLKLIKSKVIPENYSEFYSSLPSSKSVKDEAVWMRPDEEFEIETVEMDLDYEF